LVGTIDYTVTHNGNPSLKAVKGVQEIDLSSSWQWLGRAIVPGDHVIIGVWIKTTSSNQIGGARIGCDFYGTSGALIGGVPQFTPFQEPPFQAPYASTFTSNVGTMTATNVQYVAWGSDWTYQSYDFVVPSTYFTVDQWGTTEPAQQIGMLIPWLDVRPCNPSLGDWTQNGDVWFADAVIYVTSP
jgi:hypothetical protein